MVDEDVPCDDVLAQINIIVLMIALLLITYVEPISMGLIWLTGANAI